MGKKNNNKKGQVTIFIIIAIVLIIGGVLFFMFKEKISPTLKINSEENPEEFLENCLQDDLYESIDFISIHGGNPNSKLYREFKFSDEDKYYNLSYLCYNQNDYVPCIIQSPLLLIDIEKKLKEKINVKKCFDEYVSSLEDAGNSVDKNYKDFNLKIFPGRIEIDLDSKITKTKNEIVSSEKDFVLSFETKIYELTSLASEIAEQKAQYCNFEHLGYMQYYPAFNIDYFRTSDSVEIYTLAHKDDVIKFRFAIRGCVIPPL